MIEALRDDLIHGRVAHGYLLLGPTAPTEAAEFAAALVCSTPNAGLACGVCDRCRRVQSGAYSDIIRLQPEGVFYKVAQLRALIREAGLSGRESERRIFIIEQADQMREEGANAILKTLEEPEEGAVFLLCAVNRDRILSTVESRCRVLRCEAPAVAEAELDEIAATLNTACVASRVEALRLGEQLAKDKEKLAAFFDGAARILYENFRGTGVCSLPVTDADTCMALWEKAMRVPLLLERQVNTRLIADDFLLALRRSNGG